MKQREIDSDLESCVKTKGSQGDGKEKQGREVSTEVSCQWAIASEKKKGRMEYFCIRQSKIF